MGSLTDNRFFEAPFHTQFCISVTYHKILQLNAHWIGASDVRIRASTIFQTWHITLPTNYNAHLVQTYIELIFYLWTITFTIVFTVSWNLRNQKSEKLSLQSAMQRHNNNLCNSANPVPIHLHFSCLLAWHVWHLSTFNKIDESVTRMCPWHFYGKTVKAKNLEFDTNVAHWMKIPQNSSLEFSLSFLFS